MRDVLFRGLGPAKFISCLFYRLCICLQFPEPVLNFAQLFHCSVKLCNYTIDFAHRATSILYQVKYILLSGAGEMRSKLRLNY